MTGKPTQSSSLYTYSGGCSPGTLLHCTEFKTLSAIGFFHVSSKLTLIFSIINYLFFNQQTLSPFIHLFFFWLLHHSLAMANIAKTLYKINLPSVRFTGKFLLDVPTVLMLSELPVILYSPSVPVMLS